MLIPVKQIISLPVYTQSNKKLGRVVDVNLDIENHAVVQYVVESGIVNKDVFLISPTQVVSITLEKMIVVDTITKELVSDIKVNRVFSPQTFGNVTTFKEE